MNSIDPIRFTRDVFILVNIILLAGSVFVYTLNFTAVTKSTIRLFHFLKHLFTDQTKDHILNKVCLDLLLFSWQRGLDGDISLSLLLTEIVLFTEIRVECPDIICT